LGVGWFLIHLAPVIGFVPIVLQRFTWVSDHLVYLPLLGLLGLATAGASAGLDRLRGTARVAALGAILALCGAGAGLTHGHAAVFRSDAALWTDTIRRNPQAWYAHYNLGHVLLQQGRLDEATRHYEEAVRFRPDFAEAQCSFGIALLYADRRAEAIQHLEAALRTRPDLAEAQGALANVLAATGRVDDALPHYAEAARLKPADADLQFNWGNALLQAGRSAEAVEHLQEAVRLNPADAQARTALDEARKRQPAVAHPR
jgi:tetratricopeptide (TPR) repeat protein